MFTNMNASFAAHLVSLESVVSTTSGRSGGLLVGGQELAHANSIVGIQVALTNTKLQNVPAVFIFKMWKQSSSRNRKYCCLLTSPSRSEGWIFSSLP